MLHYIRITFSFSIVMVGDVFFGRDGVFKEDRRQSGVKHTLSIARLR